MARRDRDTAPDPAHDPELDQGASSIEYGLMVAAIAAVVIGVVVGLGSLVQGAFGDGGADRPPCVATSAIRC